MTLPNLITIAGPRLSAAISPHGAELQWLRGEDGRDLQWDGDPKWWTGRAPILFPVIGCVAGGVIRVDGQAYPMPKHGLVRQRPFTLAEQADDRATFAIESDAETRKSYPFDWQLEVAFAIEGSALAVRATIANRGPTAMPASFGFHPALRWPLPYGGDRADHVVRFDADEPAPIRRIAADQLVQPQTFPTPVTGDLLHPRDDLFVDDALIFDAPVSRGVRFGVPGHRAIRVDFPDLPMLGIWTKPGAPYLCIEPWQGMADPQGFAGELRDKPGVVEIAAGASRSFAMRIDSDAGTL